MVSQSDITYRLRGIPGHYGKAEVCQLVARLLEQDVGTVDVRSLARNPLQEVEKVATLTFLEPPRSLERGTTVWRFRYSDTHHEDTLDVVFDTNFYGVTPLHGIPDDECNTDCIALSGLNGHAFGSFKAKEDSFMWMRDALPKDMPKSRVYVYGYDTSMISSLSKQNLLDLGSTFAEFLKVIVTSAERKNLPLRTLLLIGHSLGGLVLEQAIVALVEDGLVNMGVMQALKGILLFGVPHLGMLNQPLIPMVRDQPNEGLVACLKTDSELLELQQKNFAAAHSKLTDAKIIASFETVETPTVEQNLESNRWKMTGSPAILVSKSSATLGCNVALPINRNHSEIVKFPYQDNDYFVVLGRLKGLRKEGQEEQNLHFQILDEDQRRALRSLGFSGQHWRRDEINPGDNTCEWLLQDQSFTVWLDPRNQDEKLLWIAGSPGTGKSTVMKFAFNFIEKQRRIDNVLVSFYFHGRGAALQRTKLGFLRSVLHQLLCRLQYLFPIFLSSYKEKLLESKDSNIQWTEVELERILLNTIQQIDKSVHICLLVDALDEIGEEAAQDHINLLRDMAGYYNVKSLFSCRRYPILRTSCKLYISMETKNEGDIQTVVRTLLSEEFQEVEEAQALEDSILGKANGMFQWAVLVTKSIVHKHSKLGNSIVVLQDTIKKLPQDLHELYASLLQGIGEDDEEDEKRQIIKLIRWLLFSIKPLTAEELQHALVTDSEDMPSSISDVRKNPYFVDQEKGAITLSKGLAEMKEHGENKIVQFIHQSIPDYLLMGDGLGKLIGSTSPAAVVGESHLAISRSCLKYALLPEVLRSIWPYVDWVMSSTSSRKDQDIYNQHVKDYKQRFPLAEYVHNYWIPHIMHVESNGIDQTDLLDLLKDRENNTALLNLLSVPNYESEFDCHYWALDILEMIYEDEKRFKDTWGRDANGPRDQCRIYPLGFENPWNAWEKHNLENLIQGYYGAWRGVACTNLVNLLSLAGIWNALKNVGMQAFNRMTYKGQWYYHHTTSKSPLLFALLANPDLKLEYIPDNLTTDQVNVEPSEELSLIFVAVASGQVELVQRFIRAGAELNLLCGLKSEEQLSPLCLAAHKNDQQLVRILLNAGADPNLSGTFSSALEYAWENKNEQMFTLLIEAGANPEQDLAKSVCRNSHHAHKDYIKRLLDFGSDSTPFPKAMRSLDVGIIDIFLQCPRTDPDLVDADGRTPLMQTVLHFNETKHLKLQRLVEHCISTGRFDLGIRDNCGETLLFHAIKKNRDTIVETLLAAGVDPNVPDINGHTALMKAVYHGTWTITQSLLADNRTNINALDNWQWTAICHAVISRNIFCANMLFMSRRLDVEDSRCRLFSVCFNALDQGRGEFLYFFWELQPENFYRELVEQIRTEARRSGKTHFIFSLEFAGLIPCNGYTVQAPVTSSSALQL